MKQIKVGPVAEGLFVLEEKQRLSRSLLWQAQRRFFERQGIEAWRQGVVPHYITSNPYLANTYARLVFAFLRDCHTMPPGQAGFPPLDPTQPLYIIELGSGSGRLAYHFLKKFLPILSRSALSRLPIKLIMTDFAERTLDFWQSHPPLQPFVTSGHLDFARFDAEQPQDLRLRHAGELLSPATVKNPVVLLANYFFDSIPQDCFYIEEGQLYEYLVTTMGLQPEADFDDPDMLEHIEVAFERRPTTAGYYDEPVFNQILRDYQQRLDQTPLLFPHLACRCLHYFQNLSAGRLLLVSGDKGYRREEELQEQGDPHINLHGSFSMMVNYHALGEYILRQGGQVHHPGHRPANLNISLFLLGRPPHHFVETAQAYFEACEQGGPDDYFNLKQALEKSYEALTLQQSLASLRLSGWDATLFLGCFPAMLKQAESAPQPWRKELRRAVEQVWDNYYPIGDQNDVAFRLGLLLYSIDAYPEALEYFQHSLRLHGPEPGTLYNLAVCHHTLGHPETALSYLRQALTLDPTLESAQQLRLKIEAENKPKPSGSPCGGGGPGEAE